MKQWLETRQVLDRLAELNQQHIGAALATVVRVRGSAYRHEGAKMLVGGDGSSVGNVSGGCLEADVREVALGVLRDRAPVAKEYCSGTDQIAAWDLGVGCEGSVLVHVQMASSTAIGAFELARECLAAHEAFCLCTDLGTGHVAGISDRALAGVDDPLVAAEAHRLLRAHAQSGIRAISGRDVFFDVFEPPPTLLILSAGDDARHLARFGAEVGFHVVVADRRPALLAPERFPIGVTLVECQVDELTSRVRIDEDTYAVVMNHNYADDREYLRVLLDTHAAYIGMLGPRQRTTRIIAEVSATRPVDEARVYGPVGLDIGTDGGEQVALSVIAEVLAVRSGREAASLRERRQPIHSNVFG